MSWFPYSIAATILLGISMSLYKLPSLKGYSSFLSTFWTNTASAFFVWVALAAFSTMPWEEASTISWYALLWGMLFALNMLFIKILLEKIETNSVYPVVSSLGSLATIGIGILLLSERMSLLQAVGMILIILSVFFFTKKGGSFPLETKTVLLSLGVIVVSTAAKYVQKLGAIYDSLTNFLVWQYIGAAVFALVIAYIFERNRFREITEVGKFWKGSALIAFFSVLGGFALLKALQTGPLSSVFAIHPSYTFVAAIMGYLLFKENLTPKKMALATISVIGVIFIRLG